MKIFNLKKDKLSSKSIIHNNQNLEAILNALIPKVLYNNASGSNGNINLSETVNNFSKIEISFRPNDGTDYTNTVIVYNPNGKYVPLSYMLVNSSGNAIYNKAKMIYINGTSISNWGSRYCEIWNGNGCSVEKQNYIYITKVVGYK